MRTIRVGVIGSGFLAESRARCYGRVSGYCVQLAGVASRSLAHAQDYARRRDVPLAFDDYRYLLDRPDIDVVDICAPNYLHKEMAIAAAAAGKHIICAKPLTGYFGEGQSETVVAHTPRRHMLEQALADADDMVLAAERAKVLLIYAENWVYAPSLMKARRLVQASGGAILEMRGGEGHSGSHSQYAKSWKYSGGGALARLGVHPIGAVLHLKAYEGMLRQDRPIRARSVTAEVANLWASETARLPTWVVTGREDVENWGVAVVTFEDNSHAVLFGSDAALGGMESSLEIFLSNARIKCQMGPANLCSAYAPDPTTFAAEYLEEKLETAGGWSHPAPDEEWALGHYAQAQDVIETVAENRAPLSDGRLGRDVVEVVYAAYVAAEEGRRIDLPRGS